MEDNNVPGLCTSEVRGGPGQMSVPRIRIPLSCCDTLLSPSRGGGGGGGYGVGFQVNLVNFTLLIWNKADTAQKRGYLISPHHF